MEVLIECPACDNLSRTGRLDPKCYVNEAKGLYYCHRCHASGRLDSLDWTLLVEDNTLEEKPSSFNSLEILRDLVPLSQSPEARGFLEGRGLDSSDSPLIKWNGDLKALALLSYDDTGSLTAVKYRLTSEGLSGQRYLAEAGSKTGYFTIPPIGEDFFKKLLIVEGELDAIAAYQAGFNGMIWALGSSHLKKERLGQMRSFKHVFMMGDNDEPGEEAAKAILMQIQTTYGLSIKAKQIRIPGICKDFNELVLVDKEAAKRFLESETRTQLELETYRLSNKLEECETFLRDRDAVIGQKTGVEGLDRLLGGGFRPHELTVYHAKPKVGKTTLLTYLAYRLLRLGQPIGLIELEVSPIKHLLPSLLSIIFETNVRMLQEMDLKLVVEKCLDTFPELDNVLCFDRYGGIPIADCLDWIRYQHRTNGIQHFFIDHSQYLVEDNSSVAEQMKAAQSLKAITTELPVHIHLIVQPTKLPPEQRLSMDTLFGGSGWGARLDNLITLERLPEADGEGIKLYLAQARSPMANPSYVPIILEYDREKCTFTERPA